MSSIDNHLTKIHQIRRFCATAQDKGHPALTRLMTHAQRDSGQSQVVASFLLSLYNGSRFKFDLTNFRRLDLEVFSDCLSVLEMDWSPSQEVHTYFKNGGEVFEKLAEDWRIKDYSKETTR